MALNVANDNCVHFASTSKLAFYCKPVDIEYSFQHVRPDAENRDNSFAAIASGRRNSNQAVKMYTPKVKTEEEKYGYIVPSCQCWIHHLQIGDIVDARSRKNEWDNLWYEAVIRCIEMKGNRKLLSIHYIGRANLRDDQTQWDEKIFADDFKRIAKRNSMTKGPVRSWAYRGSNFSCPCYDCARAYWDIDDDPPEPCSYPEAYSHYWNPN